MNSILRDLRMALSRQRTRPGQSAIVGLILALGIGASTAIFTLVDATLFHPFDLPDSDRLIRINAVSGPLERADPNNHSNSSYPVFTDYRAETSLFEGLSAFTSIGLNVGEGDRAATRVVGAVVSGNYFEVLGARASFGRTLNGADDIRGGGHPVAVISEGLSRTLFGGPDPTGRILRVNGHPLTVVGAVPADFSGVSLDSRPLVWLPLSMHGTAMPEWSVPRPDRPFVDPLDNRGFSWLDIVGRLASGVTLEQAQARLDTLAARRWAGQPEDRQDPYPALVSAKVAAIDYGGPNATRKLSWLLLGVVGMLLVLACADAASLQLAQGERRRSEIATRAALGASHAQLVRQLLAENFLTSLFATGLGLMVAVAVRQSLISSMPAGFGIPVGMAIPVLAFRPLLFASALAFVVTILFGLIPALRASRTDLVSALRSATGAGGPGSQLRDTLVVGQVAVSAILLVGAGLLLHTLANAASTRPGFEVENGIVARLDLARQGYSPERGAAFYDALLLETLAIPGVRSAAYSRHIPVDRSGMRVSIGVPGYVPKPKEFLNVDYTMTSPGFFETLGAPLIRGRSFDSRDVKGGHLVTIINEALARKYFPDRDPIGLSLSELGPFDEPVEIIGIAPDMKLRTLREEPRPAVYVPLRQAYMPSMALLVRTDASAATVTPALYEAVARLDKDLPLFGVTTLDGLIGAAVDQERSMAILLSAFGLLAVVLAGTGLGALVYHQAQTRAREFGVRLALGAGPRSVLALVLTRGARLSATGVALGLLASLGLAPLVEGFLFEVAPRDPLTFLGVAVTLALVSLLAAALPAWKASRTDPAAVLRAE